MWTIKPRKAANSLRDKFVHFLLIHRVLEVICWYTHICEHIIIEEFIEHWNHATIWVDIQYITHIYPFIGALKLRQRVTKFTVYTRFNGIMSMFVQLPYQSSVLTESIVTFSIRNIALLFRIVLVVIMRLLFIV